MNDPSLQVLLQRCVHYDEETIAAFVDKTLRHFHGNATLHGKTVLLKPNLISSVGPSLACTHARFIAGVAAGFLHHGARLVLGDSPAFGSAVKVCEKMAITQALRKMAVPIVEFRTPQRIQTAQGVILTVAKEALECDLFVGLPKIKAHNQLYMTLSVKNVFGIVKGMDKALLHMTHGATHDGFAGNILDLLALLPPQMHFADGIVAMHRSGPLDGEPLALSCAAAARSAVALDTALLTVLELEPRRSPLWRVAARRNLVGSDPVNICYPFNMPEDFHGSGFIAPATLNPIRFNPLRFLRGLINKALLRFRR